MSERTLYLWRRRIVLVSLSGGLAVALGALWSFRYAGHVTYTLPESVVTPSDAIIADSRPVEPLPSGAFGGRLSPAPPPVPVVVAPEAPKKDSRASQLELLAITRVGTDLVAAIYDKKDDVVYLVRSGESIGPVEVRAVGDRAVRVAEGTASRTLELIEPKGPDSREGGGA